MTRFAPLFALSAALATGCFFTDEDTPFIEADDVRLELPESIAAREGGQVRGALHIGVESTADHVNRWVTVLVEHCARVIAYLDDVQPNERDGDTRIYGPYADTEGRDLAWLVRVETIEDGSNYEIYVGGRDAETQAEMALLLAGDLHKDDTKRSGGFKMDFDVVEKHPEMKGPDADMSVLGGLVAVSFERDVETEEKRIDLDFQAVRFEYLGYLDDDVFYSDDKYSYTRDAEGGGSFDLTLYGEWDDYGWSGPEREKASVQAAWDGDGNGRARGSILEVEGVGDLKHGDLFLDECQGSDGFLTWRSLNEPYALEAPGYGFGDPKSCVIPASALDGL
ncbi:hypothetical protein SAMN02745121_04133 [Nannocystis exedens]|uniref:Lipoprotein n=1 Tax=Nannocystis exedens TaxID=54 RepID=A0A1I2ABN4_9BACT|nr:hypothetical protein [Nannocystis exedens]PCC69709.1 hypothetical protein NAEX_02733 [Nannocystis exedens]SFE40393.1 hypothetical protein SAMN02745121_04133 [Nannocystis exedens]